MAADLETTLKNKSFQNWLKGALAVLFAKEGLDDFVTKEVAQCHTDLLQAVWVVTGVTAGTTCSSCTTANVLPCKTLGFCNGRRCNVHDPAVQVKIPGRPCPNNICSKLKDEIRRLHRYNNPSWKNTDATRWYSDAFEVAKCFMPPDGYSDVKSLAKTDFNGTISIMINNKHFQSKMTTQLNTDPNSCTTARKIGREIRHSPDFLVSENDVFQYINELTVLLCDSTNLVTNSKAQEAVKKLNQLQTNTLTIHANDITKVLDEHIHESISKQFKDALESVKSHLDTVQKDSLDNLNKLIAAKLAEATEKFERDLSALADKKKQEFDDHANKKMDEFGDTVEIKKKEIDEHGDKVIKKIDDRHQATTHREVDQTLITKTVEKTVEVYKRTAVQQDLQEKEDTYKGLQKDLLEVYKQSHSTIPVSPIVNANDVPLLDFYVQPPMEAIDLHQKYGNTHGQPVKSKILNYQQLLFGGNGSVFQHIYVTAGAGVGKTSFSKRLCMAWCVAHSDDHSSHASFSSEDIQAMKYYEFLFYIPLRDVNRTYCKVEELVKGMIDDELPNAYNQEILNNILNERSCLVVLDGLDEWVHPASCPKSTQAFPHAKLWKKCSILTTTRHWKFDALDLKSTQIDQHIEINELDGPSTKLLVSNAVKLLIARSISAKIAKPVEEFLKRSALRTLGDLCHVPYIVLQVVCLWFDDRAIGETKCQIYTNVIELTLVRGQLSIKSKPEILTEITQLKPNGKIPKCVADKNECHEYQALLLNLGALAFNTLFGREKERMLVFDRVVASRYLSILELEFCLKVGLLCQSAGCSLAASKHSIMFFQHKSIQEYFSALHMQSELEDGSAQVNDVVLQQCSSLKSVLEMADVFVFLSGFSPKEYNQLFGKLREKALTDDITRNYRTKIFDLMLARKDDYESMFRLQTLQLECMKECEKSGDQKGEIHLPIEDVIINARSCNDESMSLLGEAIHCNKEKVQTLSVCQCKDKGMLHSLDLRSLTKLEKLELWTVPEQEDVDQLLSNSSETLKYVSLRSTQFQDNMYFIRHSMMSVPSHEALLRLPRLQALRLDCYSLSHSQLEKLSEMLKQRETMTQVELRDVQCTDHEHYCDGFVLELSKHKQLRGLNLHKVPVYQLQVNTELLEDLSVGLLPVRVPSTYFRQLPAATHLCKVQCQDLRPDDIATLIEILPQLSTVEIVYLYRINFGDTTEALLSSNMKKLQLIQLWKASVTIAALRETVSVVMNMPQSVTVVLRECSVSPAEEYESFKEDISNSEFIHVIYDGKNTRKRSEFRFQTLIRK